MVKGARIYNRSYLKHRERKQQKYPQRNLKEEDIPKIKKFLDGIPDEEYINSEQRLNLSSK